MKHAVVMWLAFTIMSLGAGGALGFVFTWMWFFIEVFFLGYGDSGPAWANAVNDIVFIVGLVLCLVGGQWAYFRKVRRQSGSAATAPLDDSQLKTR